MSALPSVVVLIGALWAAPVPDVLPSGHRSLTHELVLEPSTHFEAFDLYAWPVAGLSGETHIVPGEPFRFSSKYGTRILVVDKGAEFPEAAIDRGEDPTVASLAEHGVRAIGVIPVTEEDSALVGSPIERVLTRLRINSLADGEVQLEVVDEVVERDPLAVWALGGALAAGAVTLLMLARARRRGLAP